MDEVGVGVVNWEKGRRYEGKEVEMGEEVVKEVKKKDKLEWDFRRKEKGVRGL